MRSRRSFRYPQKLPRNCASLSSCLRSLSRSLFLLGLCAVPTNAQAQSDVVSTKPYATLDRQSVTYRGPVAPAEKDFPGSTAVIGMILPLKGPQQWEGQALLSAARVAIEQEQSHGPLPDGRRLELIVRDESGPWGQASTEILRLFEQDHALVILTSANGTSAHLAEQIANKISIPILTLSSDPSTTQANVPWLFRLGPSDADQAQAFCHRIYSELGLKKVLLVMQTDHDGKTGAAKFEKVARAFDAAPPIRFELTGLAADSESFQEILKATEPEAIVVWADAPVADELLPLVRNTRRVTPVFLCRKAAQLDTRYVQTDSGAAKQQTQISEELFTADTSEPVQISAHSEFGQLYLARTGTYPGLAARDTYEAVHMIAAALRSAGANRVLLRDFFASDEKFPRAEGSPPFDPAGNSLQAFTIVNLQAPGPINPKP
jgi:branched-chain amino acid transport system substrate-binding protein